MAQLLDSPSLKDVIRKLHDIFANDPMDPEEVKTLLRAYKTDPNEWSKYTNFEASRYVSMTPCENLICARCFLF